MIPASDLKIACCKVTKVTSFPPPLGFFFHLEISYFTFSIAVHVARTSSSVILSDFCCRRCRLKARLDVINKIIGHRRYTLAIVDK